jgi:SAM-dependent methyltransferase
MDPAELVQFYDDAYTQHTPAEGERYARWRALGAVGKADHVIALCERAGAGAGIWAGGEDRAHQTDATGAARGAGRASGHRWAGAGPASTLEIGCGDGALLAELHARGFGGRLEGVEITDAAVAIARSRAAQAGIARVERYDGSRLAAADGAYDLGILSHVLEHVPDPPALLAEAARACRAVVVEVPLEANVSARRTSKREHAHEVGHLQRLDRDGAREIVAHAGLRVVGELEDPLPLAAQTFFAENAPARARATAKWALRTGLHAAAPGLARRLFTVHYACLCVAANDATATTKAL